MVNNVFFLILLSVQMYGFLGKLHNFADEFRHITHIYAKLLHK